MKRILVVDDKPVNREYLRTVLEAADYSVFEARDGAEALQTARDERPDLVIADILMPRMDGCELVRRLRSESGIAAIPVIFLTAHYVEKDIEALAEACGVYRIITKPVEPQAVLQSVRKAIKHIPPSTESGAVERAGHQHLRLLTDTLAKKAGQLEVSNRRLDALVQLGQRIASERDPGRLLSVFCVTAGDILDACCAFVVVTEDDGRTIRHITGNGVNRHVVSRLTAPKVVTAMLSRCLPLSSVKLLRKDAADMARSGLPQEFADMDSILLAPVETASRSYGLICLAGLPLQESDDAATRRLAASMGAVLGIAYENAVRYEQIETHASALRSEVKERKRAQEQVELANEQLERRVEERTRELQESHMQLRQAERMASMGTLCAGLGHDMGNILLPIRARLQALKQTPMSTDGSEHVQSIGKYIEYLQSLTNGLRMLAVDTESDAKSPPATELSQWFQDAQPLLRSPLSGQMTLHARLPEGPVAVMLSRHQLMQAIYNLVHNAADAMRSRRTGRIEISAEVINGGRMVRCKVSDNGPGMPDEVRARAAEPFFTTKHREFSTGLGLSLVRGIVAGAGGSLSIESQPDRGTEVVLDIPAASLSNTGAGDGVGETAQARPVATVSLGDARLAALARSTLDEAGYAVGTTPSARASLWLLDAAHSDVEQVRLFLSHEEPDRIRSVLLIGSTEEQLSAEFEGVIHLGGDLRPSEFCERLRDSLHTLRSHHDQADRHSVCG